MVACEAAVPGIPRSTDEMVSLVVVIEYMPIRKAKAQAGSMPKVKGSRIAMPTSPESPGTAPKYMPIARPSSKYPPAGH